MDYDNLMPLLVAALKERQRFTPTQPTKGDGFSVITIQMFVRKRESTDKTCAVSVTEGWLGSKEQEQPWALKLNTAVTQARKLNLGRRFLQQKTAVHRRSRHAQKKKAKPRHVLH